MSVLLIGLGQEFDIWVTGRIWIRHGSNGVVVMVVMVVVGGGGEKGCNRYRQAFSFLV